MRAVAQKLFVLEINELTYGEFQINFLLKAFIRMLRGHKAVPVFPYEFLRNKVEF